MNQLAIEVVPNHALSRKLCHEILSVCSDAYEEDFASCLDLLSDAVHVLARMDGQLVCHAAWVERELRAGNLSQPLRAAYVEAVATPTRLQGRGYGKQIMRAIPPMLADYDIAALSPSEVQFYARCGWELWQGPLAYEREGDLIATPDEEVMVYRLPRTPGALNLAASLHTDWRLGDVW